MQKITYFQAAKILGVKQDTIKNAVFYDRLTRCVSPSKEAMLLKEQVELFKGKRISLKALTVEEENMWKEYKEIAESTELLDLATKEEQINEPAYVLIAKEIARAGYDTKMQKIGELIREIKERFNTIEEIQKGEETLRPSMPLALK